jgi:hypothetical protein
VYAVDAASHFPPGNFAEQSKAAKRSITKSQRELDRERRALDREEQRITLEIKKAAKAGQTVKIYMLAHFRLNQVPGFH